MEYDAVQYGSVQFRAAAGSSWSQPRRQDLPSTKMISNVAALVLSLCLFLVCGRSYKCRENRRLVQVMQYLYFLGGGELM